MNECKRLIEVAMPIKEISAESVRDKSIRRGHISTLHLWWARRPLPVCRAVVFASLVPDPLDQNCPNAFRDTVRKLLSKENFLSIGGDPYKPYDDIPYTAIHDPLEDNLRNRLLAFIGKFSDKTSKAMIEGKTVGASEQISLFSLIKWESKNNDIIINTARKLIWVAYNSEIHPELSSIEHLEAFDLHFKTIKTAEEQLYSTKDRHLTCPEVKEKEQRLNIAINSFLSKMPMVFDPFAGGGAIPLEAARLGCRSYGNDINPVAHIIQKGSVEFPQKFGKPIRFSKNEFISKYGEQSYSNEVKGQMLGDGSVSLSNRLAFDVDFYAKRLLKITEDEIGQFYPADEDGNKPVAYYWSWVGKCSNPSCKAQVPLLKQFYLSKRRSVKPDQYVHLHPEINGTEINFKIVKGESFEKAWIERRNLLCPCCGNTTDVKTLKTQFANKEPQRKLLAVIWETKNGKEYRLPSTRDILAANYEFEIINKPTELLSKGNSRDLHCQGWNVTSWGQMFSNRQLFSMQTLVNKLIVIKEEIRFDDLEYNKAVLTYLGILIDRIAARNNSMCVWHILQETVEHPFGRQAVPMVLDYPEINPIRGLSSSGFDQISQIVNFIESEGKDMFWSNLVNSSSGELSQFSHKQLNSVVTDPPYYDAIAYADLSDFFYVWLKRTLGDIYPENFSFPLTPKSEECTALGHHHSGSAEAANQHFENKIFSIFNSIEHQTNGIISIMFAHQSTKAWSTLCNAILKSNMNISGSWAVDSEVTGALKSEKAFLASSVTVSCRPSKHQGVGDFREVRKSINEKIKLEVKQLYSLGFRGADLLTACFGQAVSEFGKYEKVEKSDGTEVTVAELLDITKEAAFSAIISDIDTDDITRFYIGWANFFGFTEADHDDVRRITQIGLNVDVNELVTAHVLIRVGSKERLASFKERCKALPKLGEKENCPVVDQAHKLLFLYEQGNRVALLQYINQLELNQSSTLWRVLNSLVEVLPTGLDDHKQIVGFLANKDSLLNDAKQAKKPMVEQLDLGMQ